MIGSINISGQNVSFFETVNKLLKNNTCKTRFGATITVLFSSKKYIMEKLNTNKENMTQTFLTKRTSSITHSPDFEENKSEAIANTPEIKGINENNHQEPNEVSGLYDNTNQQPLNTSISTREASNNIQNSTDSIKKMIDSQNVNINTLRDEILSIADNIQGAVVLIKSNGGAININSDQKVDLMQIQSNLIQLSPLLEKLIKSEFTPLDEKSKSILRVMLRGEKGSLQSMTNALQNVLNIMNTLP